MAALCFIGSDNHCDLIIFWPGYTSEPKKGRCSQLINKGFEGISRASKVPYKTEKLNCPGFDDFCTIRTSHR